MPQKFGVTHNIKLLEKKPFAGMQMDVEHLQECAVHIGKLVMPFHKIVNFLFYLFE